MNDTKEHILNTTLKLFMQKGFKEVTMKDIVDSAELSKGAFYHYFSGKEQVFAEVIKHFFTEIMTENTCRRHSTSLKEFYENILSQTRSIRKKMSQLFDNNSLGVSSTNYYYLVFDAMRILPNFRKQQAEMQARELQAWEESVRMARENGEIASEMSDEQLAKMFIYLGDGVNINRVMNNSNSVQFDRDLKALWDNLYSSIKRMKG